MEWIRTSERLPEFETDCLVLYGNDFIFIGGLAFSWENGAKKIWWYLDHFNGDHSFVSLKDGAYWMPLPELPEVEE